MAAETRVQDDARELRLEGWGLVLVGAVFVALLIGAFHLGRTVERQTAPARGTAASEPARGSDEELVDASSDVTFFDTLSAPGQQAEPRRETAGTPPPGSTPPPAASAAGPWFVQVFVGRDRTAAEEVVKTLRGKGYPVRTEAVREGASGSLYKVRVGGFLSREAADDAATRLHRDGQPSTWVVKTGA